MRRPNGIEVDDENEMVDKFKDLSSISYNGGDVQFMVKKKTANEQGVNIKEWQFNKDTDSILFEQQEQSLILENKGDQDAINYESGKKNDRIIGNEQ